MRVSLMAIKACELGVDTFVYLPKKKMFFFCDDVSHEEDKVILYFEQDIDQKNGGLIETETTLDANETVLVVSDYNINPEMILEDKKNYYEGLLADAKSDLQLGSDEDNLQEKVDNLTSFIEDLNKEIEKIRSSKERPVLSNGEKIIKNANGEEIHVKVENGKVLVHHTDATDNFISLDELFTTKVLDPEELWRIKSAVNEIIEKLTVVK